MIGGQRVGFHHLIFKENQETLASLMAAPTVETSGVVYLRIGFCSQVPMDPNDYAVAIVLPFTVTGSAVDTPLRLLRA